jgi:hypothetical protein
VTIESTGRTTPQDYWCGSVVVVVVVELGGFWVVVLVDCVSVFL